MFDRYGKKLIRQKEREGKRLLILGDEPTLRTENLDRASLRMVIRVNVVFLTDSQYEEWRKSG